MLGSNGGSWAIQSSENDWAMQLARTHVVQLGSTVDYVVNSLQSEIHCHEFNNRFQSHRRSSDTYSSEPCLGDRSVDDSLGTVLVDQALWNFVGTMVLPNFFSHKENFFISFQLFIQSFI